MLVGGVLGRGSRLFFLTIYYLFMFLFLLIRLLDIRICMLWAMFVYGLDFLMVSVASWVTSMFEANPLFISLIRIIFLSQTNLEDSISMVRPDLCARHRPADPIWFSCSMIADECYELCRSTSRFRHDVARVNNGGHTWVRLDLTLQHTLVFWKSRNTPNSTPIGLARVRLILYGSVEASKSHGHYSWMKEMPNDSYLNLVSLTEKVLQQNPIRNANNVRRLTL